MTDNNTEKKFFIINQFNPRGNRIGGIGSYILSFIKNAPNNYRFKLIGLTSKKEELFQWQIIKMGNATFDFYPICLSTDENINQNSWLPITFMFVWGLLKARLKTPIDSIIFMHRLEYMLPFLFSDNVKFLLFHSDLEKQLDRNSSEVIWAKFPLLYKLLLRVLLSKFEHLFSVSSNTMRYIQNISDTYKNKISFSPTWADSELFFLVEKSKKLEYRKQISEQFSINLEKKWLLFVGRFQKVKNISLLIDAMEKLDGSFELLLAGAGDDLESIKNYTSERQLQEHIHFLGSVHHQKIGSFYMACDLYLSASFSEGMSVALIEALQSGLPVVTTPTGESKKIIVNGSNGFITKNWEVNEFVDNINKVFQFTGEVQENCVASVNKFAAKEITKKMLTIMSEDKH